MSTTIWDKYVALFYFPLQTIQTIYGDCIFHIANVFPPGNILLSRACHLFYFVGGPGISHVYQMATRKPVEGL